jgi:hypothetical protein
MEPEKDLERLARNCEEWDGEQATLQRIFCDALRLIPDLRGMLMRDTFISRDTLDRIERAGGAVRGDQRDVIRKIRKYALSAGVFAGLSREEIRKWLVEGGKRGATHMLVVYDVGMKEVLHPYVLPPEMPVMRASLYEREPDLCVIAVISFQMFLEKQLVEDRPWHTDL